MFYYFVYGLKVQSNIKFPQLFACDEDNTQSPELFIEVSSGDSMKKKLVDPQNPDVNVGKTENGMWFYNQAGTFLLEHKDGISHMKCEKYDGVPDDLVRAFFLGNCIAIIMTYREKIVLHGSTVVMGDKTVLVCGDSGTGKSTTSMALLDMGGKLLSDDISVLDVDPADGKVYSIPGFPEQKLCRDAALENGFNLDELRYIDEDRDKFSVDRRDIFLTEKKCVDMLITLHTMSEEKAASDMDFENGLRIKKIDGAEKANAVIDRFFLRWMYGYGFSLKPQLMLKCVTLAAQIDILDVTRIREIDTKDYMLERLMEEIRG